MDLTKYGPSPYGEKGAARLKGQESNLLAAGLRGFLGAEQQGSVLDPGRAGQAKAHDAGQAISALSDLASLAPAKLLPAAAGIFIGQKSKLWNAEAAALARRMLTRGIDEDLVKKLTNTSIADRKTGALRQELSDVDSAVTRALLPKEVVGPADTMFRHPKMYEAYPELRDYTVSLRKGPFGGEYLDNKIGVVGETADETKEGILHEFNHAVQELEGWPRGGSPEEFQKAAEWAAKKMGKPPEWAVQKAYDDYFKLHGEAVARLGTSRRGLTQEELPGTPFEYDVPESKQLYRYHDGDEPIAAKALRRGGRPDLYLAHGASATNLFDVNGNLIRELMHPSFAITKDGPKAPWGDVMLIPREGKFDPRTSSSSLHNMDAWTPTWEENISAYPQLREAAGLTLPQARLEDRFQIRFPKGGLNVVGEGALGSLRFPSFEAFENSPLGAGRLGGKITDPETSRVIAWLRRDSRGHGVTNKEMLQLYLTDPSFGYTNAARAAMQHLRKSPQEYAELKQWGPVQLSPDNFAGAMVKENSPRFFQIESALKDRGINVLPMRFSGSAFEKGHYAEQLQNLSRMQMMPKAKSMPFEWDAGARAQKAAWAGKAKPRVGAPVITPAMTPEGETVVDLLKKGLTDDQIAALPGFEWWMGK